MRIAQAMTLAALLVAGSARAQGRDVTAADALFRDARALMKKGEFDAACPKLVESHQLDPAPGTAINLGDCWEKVGRLADALQVLRDALDLLRAGDHRIPLVKKQIAALEPRVPRLTITLAGAAPDGTKVKRDGIEVGAGSIGSALPVNPGEHTIEVTAPGRESRSFAVTVRAGESRHAEVIPGAPRVPPPREAANAKGTQPGASVGAGANAEDTNSQRTIGFVALGASAAALGAAGIVWLQANGKADDAERICDRPGSSQAECNSATDGEQRLRATGNVVIGVSAVFALTGVVLILTAPSSERAGTLQVRGVSFAPFIQPASVGAQIGGAW
jgi:hypothetical protein